MELPLSAALRMGSLLVEDPRAGDIDRCGVNMILAAHGRIPNDDDYFPPVRRRGGEDEDEPNSYEFHDGEREPLPMRLAEAYSDQWFHALNSHQALLGIYPWLNKTFSCPWCGDLLKGTALVHHPFDKHVMPGAATMDALCSWISSIEPPPDNIPKRLNLGLGVHWATEAEKSAVLAEAAKGGLTPNAYVTAAVRLVMEKGMTVEAFQLADPKIGPGVNVNYAPNDFHTRL